MEFSFISSSLKLPFTPRPRLSQRRSPVTTELKYQVRVPKRWQGICCSSFLAPRDHTFSTSVVRSHWRTAGNVFWVNQWPFHKVLLELKFLLSCQKCPRFCNTEDKRIPMGVSLSPSQLGCVLGTAASAAQVLALTPGKTSWPLFR